jgi:hypothetical protein
MCSVKKAHRYGKEDEHNRKGEERRMCTYQRSMRRTEKEQKERDSKSSQV